MGNACCKPNPLPAEPYPPLLLDQLRQERDQLRQERDQLRQERDQQHDEQRGENDRLPEELAELNGELAELTALREENSRLADKGCMDNDVKMALAARLDEAIHASAERNAALSSSKKQIQQLSKALGDSLAEVKRLQLRESELVQSRAGERYAATAELARQHNDATAALRAQNEALTLQRVTITTERNELRARVVELTALVAKLQEEKKGLYGGGGGGGGSGGGGGYSTPQPRPLPERKTSPRCDRCRLQDCHAYQKLDGAPCPNSVADGLRKWCGTHRDWHGDRWDCETNKKKKKS